MSQEATTDPVIEAPRAIDRKMPFGKYRTFESIRLVDRTWPDKVLDKAPIWCSVDLRDGNQALIEPMMPDEKLRMYRLLIELGFKEIEVGFPSASQTDFDFVRLIIEKDLIPADVTIQVLCQAREELIDRTIEAVAGARRVIFHLYNSTSTLQRRVVFRMNRQEITQLAIDAVNLLQNKLHRFGDTEVVLEYSPESYTGTEMDFAVEICDSVMRAWGSGPQKQIILNLPATVEMSTPNIYADQIEWFVRHLPNRDHAVISLHTHNDRGTGVAATEMGILAGAQRVEGTLFGNGERTGNCDLIAVAMNLFSQGVDPQLYLSNMPDIVDTVESCNKIPVHVRHPYAGELVFTAFSGSHQDAIKKGMDVVQSEGGTDWEVPYLPIDPADVGSSYRETVRVNSQSGKGGVAFLLQHFHGVTLPKPLLQEFSAIVQKLSEKSGEMSHDIIWQTFRATYVDTPGPYALVDYQVSSAGDSLESCRSRIRAGDSLMEVNGEGSGPIDAFVNGLVETLNEPVNVQDYQEYALGRGKEAQAICILTLNDDKSAHCYGVGISRNTTTAAFQAIIAATNRRWSD